MTEGGSRDYAIILVFDIANKNFTSVITCASGESPYTIAVDQDTGELYYMGMQHIYLYENNNWTKITDQVVNANFFNSLGGGLLIVDDLMYPLIFHE